MAVKWPARPCNITLKNFTFWEHLSTYTYETVSKNGIFFIASTYVFVGSWNDWQGAVQHILSKGAVDGEAKCILVIVIT